MIGHTVSGLYHLGPDLVERAPAASLDGFFVSLVLCQQAAAAHTMRKLGGRPSSSILVGLESNVTAADVDESTVFKARVVVLRLGLVTVLHRPRQLPPGIGG